MTYTINTNPEFNSLEISFTEKPHEKVIEALKALKFRWHRAKALWYGYADESELRKALGENVPEATPTEAPKTEKTNKFGVKVGDLFSASWGYEQTNVDFFQVVALVGESSVRVREVYPEILKEKAVSGMSADYTYKLTRDILPPASSSVFIKDQEKGDLKRLQLGYCADPEEAKKYCSFKLSTYATAHKCNGETVTKYVSWYA